MSDEHEDEEQGVAMYKVDDAESLEYAIDHFFECPVLLGSKMPEWEVVHSTCESGCCQHTILADNANEVSYLVATVPTMIVEMSKAMGSHVPNPARPELARRVAALN